ncbi:MAG: PQQ-dependent sugar dehydrogenase [Gammaproteobacteria bacterium]
MKRTICRTLFFVVLFGVGCTQPPPGKGQGEIAAAQSSAGGVVQFRVETVASGLEVPWAIAFAPDGRIFFTERPGRVRVIEGGRLASPAKWPLLFHQVTIGSRRNNET